jgi:hypothetical protein
VSIGRIFEGFMSSAKWVTKNYATEESTRTHIIMACGSSSWFWINFNKKSWYPVKKGFVCMENSWRCSAGGIAKQIEYFFTLPLFLGIKRSKSVQKSLKLINYILICLFSLPFFEKFFIDEFYESF